MFATTILDLPELPPDPGDTRIYDLNPLRERGFQFLYDPASDKKVADEIYVECRAGLVACRKERVP
jgi:hypothetical protein